MCGIAGCFRLQGSESAPFSAEEILKPIRHRGPDAVGACETGRGGLAQARLAIIDVEGGSQPMLSADGSHWIAYNGETYNYLCLGEKLGGQTLKTRSDTEVVLSLYLKLGPECLRLLDGMFSFAILGRSELFLARDALGIKPLYHSERDGWLYFASEAKALIPLGSKITEFPPGSWYSSGSGFHRYFSLEDWAGGPPGEAEPAVTIRGSLESAVEERLVSDVPVGVFLSGGGDSSIVAAIMKKRVEQLHSFSVGMPGSSDLDFARRVASYLGTEHHERVFTEADMVKALPEIIYHLESFDFALVRSAVANYLVAELASRHLKVVLAGEGADEVYSGYHYLKELRETERSKELLRITAALHNLNLQRVDRMTMAHGLEARVPYLDLDHVRAALRVPAALKERGGVEKWALREAFSGSLPDDVLWRTKEKFSRGAGSAGVFERIAGDEISDAAFEREKDIDGGLTLRSKEELYYYRVFKEFFPDSLIKSLGWTARPEAR